MARHDQFMPTVHAEKRTPDQITTDEWDLIKEKLTQATMTLVFSQPMMGYFFYELKAKTRWVMHPNEPAGDPLRTMATDGTHLFAWPFFVLCCPQEQLTAVCLHETLHCVLMHLTRMRGRGNKRWNAAVDYVTNMYVNDIARTNARVDVPKDHLAPKDYELMSWFIPTNHGWYYDERFRDPKTKEPYPAEAVYDRLKDYPDLVDGGIPIDAHGASDLPGAAPLDPADLLDRVRNAYNRGKLSETGKGIMPGGLEVLLKSWLFPPLPWQKMLLRWLKPAKGHWAWAPGDTRHEDAMPHRSRVKRLEYLPVIVDTSGSMSDEEIAAAVAECRAIVRQFRGIAGILILCDAGIHYVGPLSDPYPTVKGRGGTDMRPAFDYLERENLAAKTKVALSFTDGELYGGWCEDAIERLGIDVLWTITNHRTEVPKHPRFYAARLHSVADYFKGVA